MLFSIAGIALALQLGTPSYAPSQYIPSAREIRYRRQAGSPSSDGYYPLEYGGGRRPVPCGHGADSDIRDGLCYKTGTVPRRYQTGRPGYHVRRNGYYEMR